MAKYRVVKQLLPKGQSKDPVWATRTSAYTAVLSGSSDQVWEFENESEAWWNCYNYQAQIVAVDSMML